MSKFPAMPINLALSGRANLVELINRDNETAVDGSYLDIGLPRAYEDPYGKSTRDTVVTVKGPVGTPYSEAKDYKYWRVALETIAQQYEIDIASDETLGRPIETVDDVKEVIAKVFDLAPSDIYLTAETLPTGATPVQSLLAATLNSYIYTGSILVEIKNSGGEVILAVYTDTWAEDTEELYKKLYANDENILTDFYIEYDFKSLLQNSGEIGSELYINYHSRWNNGLDSGNWDIIPQVEQYPILEGVTLTPGAEWWDNGTYYHNGAITGYYNINHIDAFYQDHYFQYEGSNPETLPEKVTIMHKGVGDLSDSGWNRPTRPIWANVKNPGRIFAGFKPSTLAVQNDVFIDNWGLLGSLEIFFKSDNANAFTARPVYAFIGVIKRAAREKAVADLVPEDIVCGILCKGQTIQMIIGSDVVAENTSANGSSWFDGQMVLGFETVTASNSWTGYDGMEQAIEQGQMTTPFENIVCYPYSAYLIDNKTYSGTGIRYGSMVNITRTAAGATSFSPSGSIDGFPISFSSCEFAIINDTDLSDAPSPILFEIINYANFDRERIQSRVIKG